jgi:cation-transporting ATPase 13A1
VKFFSNTFSGGQNDKIFLSSVNIFLKLKSPISSHYVSMITGDASLTAIHVAKTTGMLPQDDTQIYTFDLKTEKWHDLDHLMEFDLEKMPNDNLCLTGVELAHILAKCEQSFITRLLIRVRVFARVSPKQKELIILELKEAGFYTVMCGDGTNDVGALRHSHVGVALLASSVGEKLEKQREFMEKKRKADMLMRMPSHGLFLRFFF